MNVHCFYVHVLVVMHVMYASPRHTIPPLCIVLEAGETLCPLLEGIHAVYFINKIYLYY